MGQIGLRVWLGELLTSFRNFISGNAGVDTIEIHESFYGKRAVLHRIRYYDRIPGCIEVWRYCRLKSQEFLPDLAIFVVNLSAYKQAQSELLAGGQINVRSERDRSNISRQLSLQLEGQRQVDGSHLWILAWLPISPAEHGVNPKRDVRIVHCFVADFQGVLGAIAGDRYAIQCTKIVALQTLKATDGQPNWDAIVTNTDWLKCLNVCAQKSISPDHVLQPQKPTRNRGQIRTGKNYRRFSSADF